MTTTSVSDSRPGWSNMRPICWYRRTGCSEGEMNTDNCDISARFSFVISGLLQQHCERIFYDGWLHYTLRFCLIKAVNNIEKAYVVVQNIIFTFLCEYRGQNNIHLLSPLHDIVVCIVRLQELKFNDRAEKRIQERTHKQCKLRLSKRGFV